MPLLELRGISKRLNAVHALVMDNGADAEQPVGD